MSLAKQQMRCNCNASDLTAPIQLVSKWQNEYVTLMGTRLVLYPRTKTDVLDGSATRNAYGKRSSCPRKGRTMRMEKWEKVL